MFVHIPKVAGRSVESFFLDLHGLAWKQKAALLLERNTDPGRGPERLAHLTAEEYMRCGHLSGEEFRSLFKFAFVRNPWARLVSEYRYRHYDRRRSFREFVTTGLPTRDAYSDFYRHIMPQYEFLHDADGELLVDYVGRFETLQNDFDTVCSRLGITESTLPHVNSSGVRPGILGRVKNWIPRRTGSPGMPFRSYYDEELVEIVGEIYAKDISTFGYRFDE